MRRLLIYIAISLVPVAARAECYMRSATVNQMAKPVTRIADVRRFVTPADNNQFKCVVAFRAEVNHVWHNGEGTSMGTNGDSIDQVCSQALDTGRSYLLNKMGGKYVTEQDMVCKDDPQPEVKAVRVGDVVQISELAPHPQKPNFFDYKGTKCRWFVESDFDPKTRDIFQWQGVACLVRKGEWQVVDKF